MARGAGFPVADVDVGIFGDQKIRKLVRQCPDEATAARATIAYLAALLESWSDGERIPVDDAAPMWLTNVGDLRDRLAAVGLVDAEGRIREHAWESWFGPALQRRVERQESGRKGGLAKAPLKPSSSGATAELHQDSSSTQPEPTELYRTDPTEPTDPSNGSPKSPPSGDHHVNPRADGTNPRALGTNPRANADREAEAREEGATAKRWRQSQRDIAYHAGILTEAQHREHTRNDTPLKDIPGWTEHQAKIRAEAQL